MASQWFIARDGVDVGKATSAELRTMARSGELLPTDQLWKEGMKDWRIASDFPQLFPAEQAATVVVSPDEEEKVDAAPIINIDTAPRARPRKGDVPTAVTVVGTANATAKKATASLKSAGSLIAKKAEQTKIVTVTLPRAYAELGKVVYKDGTRREQFADLFTAIEDLLARRKQVHEEALARPAGSGLAEKAMKVAADAAALARTKAIDLETYQAFARLGEAVYEQHGSDAGSAEVVEPITAAVARRDQLAGEISEIVSVAASTGKDAGGKTSWLKVGGVAFLCLAVIASCIDNDGGGGKKGKGGGGGGGSDDGGGGTGTGTTIRPLAKDLPSDPEMRDMYEVGWEKGATRGNEWLAAMRGHAEGQPLQAYAKEHAWVEEKRETILARPISSIKTMQMSLQALIRENAEPLVIKGLMARIHEAQGFHDGFKVVSAAGLKGKDTSNATTKRTDITTLTVAEARRLVQRDSWLVIKNPTTITDEVAEVLAQFPLGLDLAGVTSLSDKAVDILARKQAGHLRLGGLKSLSDKAAKSLSQSRSPVMILDSVPAISDKAAAYLAQQPGVCLSLDGLTNLSEQGAKALAQYRGELHLGGLTSLRPDVAKALAQHQDVLSLKGLTTLSNEVANVLAQQKGALYLDGLPTLSNEAAKALAKHWGSLSLNGLTTLSPEVATALVQSTGELSFNGLATLSPEVAAVLARHESRLYLKGLKTLSDEAKRELGKHRRITMPDEFR